MKFFVGLDLGQASDYTAIVVLEKQVPTHTVTRTWRDAPGFECKRDEQEPLPAIYECRHLQRVRDRPYPTIVERVAELMREPEHRGNTALVVDYTGVGRPVVDMLRDAGVERLIPVTITAGTKAAYENGWRVPKVELVSAVAVLLQRDRLKIPRHLANAKTLTDELVNFRVKIDSRTAHDSYGAWREKDHDDLVLATACAAWYGERYKPQVPSGRTCSFYVPLR